MRSIIGFADRVVARRQTFWTDVSLIILRVGLGATMLASHGWGKLSKFSTLKEQFPDPLGVGSGLSLTLAVFAEVFAAALLVLGLGTRLAAFPLAITMAVAFFIVHADDPFQKKELAFIYLFGFVTLLLAGGGRFSLDAKLWPKIRRMKQEGEHHAGGTPETPDPT